MGAIPMHAGLNETDTPHPCPSPEGEGLKKGEV